MLFKIFVSCFMLKLVSGSMHSRNEDEVHCYSGLNISDLQHEQFSTKTAYATIKGTLAKVDYEVKDCEPVKVWLLSRHGAAYPSNSTMDELSKLDELRNKTVGVTPRVLCDGDIDLLNEWILLKNQTPEDLSPQGEIEMKTLAQEYKDAFSDLFGSPANFLFRHTTEQRVNKSFSEFATALFGEIDDVEEDISDNDMLLKFYERCEKWTENKENLSKSKLSDFERSDLFTNTIKEVTVRLGLSDELTAYDVKNIWDMCRFDRAWANEKLSPWCAAFTPDHINVLEYREDLKLYYKTGYGANINSRVACKTVVDLLDHFENTSSHKVSVSFAHATTIQLFLTALGANKDELQPSNDDMTGMSNRTWKSSNISPFASNLAVVKYTCSNDEHQVKFFLNQKPLVLDWCNELNVCKLADFIDAYLSFKEANCNDYFCSDTSGKAKTLYGVFAITVNLILIYLL